MVKFSAISESPFQQERDKIISLDRSKLVTPAAYADLAVSRAKLVRLEIPSADLVGLANTETGEWFVVEAEKLRSPLNLS